jgi:hypothetical protein
LYIHEKDYYNNPIDPDTINNNNSDFTKDFEDIINLNPNPPITFNNREYYARLNPFNNITYTQNPDNLGDRNEDRAKDWTNHVGKYQFYNN